MSNNGSLELRRRGYQNFEGKGFWLGVGLLLVTTLIFIIIILIPTENGIFTKISEAFTGKGSILPISNLLFSWLALIAIRVDFQSKLILDDTGIIYISGIPKKFQLIRLDWQYRWSDISGATFRKESFVGPLMSSVGLIINSKTTRIIPWRWVDPNDTQDKNATKGSFMASQASLHQKVKDTAVMKFLESRGILNSEKNLDDPADALNSNRIAQIITGLFIVCILYFITDVFFGLDEYYAPTTPWFVFILCGCLGIYGSYKMLLREKLQKNYCIAMAVLFGLGIGFISYPLSIRLNIWTDDQGLISYTYELGSGDKWIPRDSRAPVLDFDRRSKYWAQFNVGEQKVFELRRGVFGFTQIYMKDIYEDQKKFYRSN